MKLAELAVTCLNILINELWKICFLKKIPTSFAISIQKVYQSYFIPWNNDME